MNTIDVGILIQEMRRNNPQRLEAALDILDGGTHRVTTVECEGPAHPDSHKLSHLLFDNFGWFHEVQVKNRQNLFIIEIHHDYPEGIDIEAYTDSWLKGHFREGRARFTLEFHRC